MAKTRHLCHHCFLAYDVEAMVPEIRNGQGRLRVPYFIALIREYIALGNTYNEAEFKDYVVGLGVLRSPDLKRDSTGAVYWKHSSNRAWQKVHTNI